MNDTYGPKSSEPFASWHPNLSCWKTSEATSLWALTLSSLTLPAWGGLHDGELFELPTPELPTSGRDCSSLPTPRTSDTNGAGRHGDGGLDLRTAVTLLPTPTTQDKVGVRGDFNWDSPNQTLREVASLLGQPGATTAPLSPDGSASSDDPHPHLLSLDGLAHPA